MERGWKGISKRIDWLNQGKANRGTQGVLDAGDVKEEKREGSSGGEQGIDKAALLCHHRQRSN